MRTRRFITCVSSGLLAFSVLPAVTAAGAPSHSPVSHSTRLTASAPVSPLAPHTAPKIVTSKMHVRPAQKVVRTSDGKYFAVMTNGQRIPLTPLGASLVRKRIQEVARARIDAARAAAPDATLPGDCGTSFVQLSEYLFGRPIAVYTGFTVIHRAVEYSWYVRINGPRSFVENYEPSGALLFKSSWSGSYKKANQPSGLWIADVNSYVSYALLDDGDICFSAGPYDQERL